jgi:hypothetical protein
MFGRTGSILANVESYMRTKLSGTPERRRAQSWTEICELGADAWSCSVRAAHRSVTGSPSSLHLTPRPLCRLTGL